MLESIFIEESPDKLVRVMLKDINYIQAYGEHVLVFVGGKKHMLKTTMKKIHERLPKTFFIHIHKSYIVNIFKVEAVNKRQRNLVEVCIGKESIPVSEGYKKEVLEKLNVI